MLNATFSLFFYFNVSLYWFFCMVANFYEFFCLDACLLILFGSFIWILILSLSVRFFVCLSLWSFISLIVASLFVGYNIVVFVFILSIIEYIFIFCLTNLQCFMLIHCEFKERSILQKIISFSSFELVFSLLKNAFNFQYK